MTNNIQLHLNEDGEHIGALWVGLVPQKGNVIVFQNTRYIVQTVEWYFSTGAGLYKVQLNIKKECF